eukprot:TRINITY_DN63336_c0_g1_i1.p1 TRINITY_DN63336_c0_g1~~TRINITY_DN63336_c0_g1_i1.p1  ORF type:complete len:103 (+),score=10.71 TRINITY_DN63336_c0_g1_i1:26-310(+)
MAKYCGYLCDANVLIEFAVDLEGAEWSGLVGVDQVGAVKQQVLLYFLGLQDSVAVLLHVCTHPSSPPSLLSPPPLCSSHPHPMHPNAADSSSSL